MGKRLMIGAGGSRAAGWKTLDADPRSRADYIAEVPPLPDEVKSERWEAIEMIHVIEHFYQWDAMTLLRECFDILEPGGRLILEAPNIEFAAAVIAGLVKPPKGSPGQFDLWPLYGDPTRRNPLYGHRWGWSPSSLSKALVDVGFNESNVVTMRAKHHFPIRDFRVEARR